MGQRCLLSQIGDLKIVILYIAVDKLAIEVLFLTTFIEVKAFPFHDKDVKSLFCEQNLISSITKMGLIMKLITTKTEKRR